MRNPPILLLAAGLALAPLSAQAAITYPKDTAIEDAWASPPRITPDAAIPILLDRLLTRRADDAEPEISEEEFEAFKYLRGNPDQVHEEPSPVADSRDYVSDLLPETMTVEQADFLDRLSAALSARLGLEAASAAIPVCVKDVELFRITKVRWRIGFFDLQVWGIAAFAHNLRYATNNSDVVYGIFPFGFETSWWGAIQCAFNQPANEQELRACGREKVWQLQDASTLTLSPLYRHSVPGVAQASLTYAGALLVGEANQFRTAYQTRPAMDPSWLLGPSNVPSPSRVQFFTAPSIGGSYIYDLWKVVSWEPTIVLNVGYNWPTFAYYETYTYDGRGGGNPHTLGNFYAQRTYSRFHDPIVSCN